VTAEVAILNRSAVSLAADSALTVGQGAEQKIYHTHKLFMLSHVSPVGVMIFNSASILGVPWETIIKQYRKERGNQTFDHLYEYAENFTGYLNNNSFFFSDESAQDQAAISDMLTGFLAISDMMERAIQAVGKLPLAGILTLLEDTANAMLEALTKAELPPYPANHKYKVYSRYLGSIDTLITEVFQNLPIGPVLRKKLRRVGLYLIVASTAFTGDTYTGIVIAGFGERDIFPALDSKLVRGIVLGQARYNVVRKRQVASTDRALIYAFAQSDVVKGFMDGITDEMSEFLKQAVKTQLESLGNRVLGKLPKMKRAKKDILIEELNNAKQEILEIFRRDLKQYCRDVNSAPIVETVALLPKEELAVMAETLVNLTSFKRRVTLDLETVGGPVDVAIITKGDGFVWIKRKHYFDATLNPQYFKNHF
jgi:hypothetical protein